MYRKWLFGLLVVAVAVAWYVFHIHALNYVPQADSDEISLLNIPYRFAELGDWSYPLIYSDTFNSGAIRAYPPLLSLAPRALYHALFGFSANLSRWFSAALMAGVAGMVVALAFRFTRSSALAFLVAAVFAVGPTFFLLSRSVRFEQCAVFLGLASVALPFLALPRTGSADRLHTVRGTVVWIAAAACCALAAGSHPIPLGFGLPLAVNVLLGSGYWAPRDGLTFSGRLIATLAGGVPFVILSVAPLVYVEGGYGAYLASISDFVAERNATIEDLLVKSGPSFLLRLSTPIAADFVAIGNTSFARQFDAGVTAVGLRLAPFVIVALILGAAVHSARSLFQPEGLPSLVGISTLLGLIIVRGLYAPGPDYGIYIGVACLVAVALPPRVIVTGEGPWRTMLIATLCITVASGAFTSLPHASTVLSTVPARHATLDRHYAILREEGRRAFAAGEDGALRETRIYTDTIAWMAAYPAERSYLEILGGSNRGDIDGLAVDVRALNYFLTYYPAPEGTAVARDLKARRFLAALEPLDLVGVVYFAPYRKQTLLYRLKRGPTGLRLRHVSKDRDEEHVAEAAISLEGDGDLWRLPPRMKPGCYVVAVLPTSADSLPPFLLQTSDAEAQGEQLQPYGMPIRTAAHMIFKLPIIPKAFSGAIRSPGSKRIDAYRLSPDPTLCHDL